MNEHTQICQSCGETVEGSYSLLDHESGAHGYVYQCTNMSCMETWEEDEAPADEDGQTIPQDSQTLTADESLAEQMKAAGMMSIEEMMQPMNRFQVHTGMTDLKFFEQWLECRTEQYVRMFARWTIEKKTDDDMYEWVLAHKAAFHEVLVNFRAAINQGQG